MNQVKLVILIQVFNSFVNGVFVVALPLMMEARNLDVVTIGLVFAALPLIFQVGRMFFATLSDFWGRKLFLVSNGVFGAITGLIYSFAQTPLEFVFGRVIEGVKAGSLWAVNRPFMMEKSERKWRSLIHLRTTAYVASAAGSLIAGFLIVWLFFEGALLLCAVIGALVIPVALLLFGERRERFSVMKALRFLDVRKKEKLFKLFLVLFFTMGLAFGLRDGFVFPLFLSSNGFDPETVGVLLGSQILLAGLFSYLFAREVGIKRFLLVSGLFYTVTLLLLGVSSWWLAGILTVVYGVVEGLLSVGMEGILAKITSERSYGTDIGLLMMGLHSGRTVSLALSGFFISWWGFIVPFWLSAVIYTVFYTVSYRILTE